MREDVIKTLVTYLCRDIEDFVLLGLEENKELFPLFNACADYICGLKEMGIDATITHFSDQIQCALFNEIKRYLVR